jgi:hypothetical protein
VLLSQLLPLLLAVEGLNVPALPADLARLVQALRQHGFQVRLEAPQRRDVYGLFEARSRTLWITPISFALGIGRPTLLHEAAHAVQSCPLGVVQPVGWSLPLSPVVKREIEAITYTRYGHGNKAVEREAFALQGQPNAVELLLRALRQRCRRSAP